MPAGFVGAPTPGIRLSYVCEVIFFFGGDTIALATPHVLLPLDNFSAEICRNVSSMGSII